MDARALAANITIVNPAAEGYLQVYPADLAPPATSVLSFRAGAVRASSTILALGDDGAVSAVYGALSGTANVLIDVSGYFQ